MRRRVKVHWRECQVYEGYFDLEIEEDEEYLLPMGAQLWFDEIDDEIVDMIWDQIHDMSESEKEDAYLCIADDGNEIDYVKVGRVREGREIA